MPEAPGPALAIGAPPRRRLWLGLALLLLSALMFSLHNTLARLSYDEGVAPTTINAARTSAVLLLFVLMFGARGQWPRVPRAAWLAFAVTALCYSLHNPLLLVAFQFVPVSLAILVLYFYPLLVAFMAAAIGQERLRRRTLAAAAVAFAGVALVLEVGGVALDWRGLALAAVAATALAGNIVGAAQLNRHMRALAVPFALSTLGAIVFNTMMLADGGPTLPATLHGWWILGAATLTSPAAIFAFYLALPRAGAPRSSLVMNAEPVVTVLLAVALLGESLGWLQIAGAVLIIGALAVHAVIDLKFRRL
ncbi:MAG TPA: EamA family transporter [Alphaproteobacteria bacterium]